MTQNHAMFFDAAFAPSEPLEVEYLTEDKLIANVIDNGVTLLVTAYYCAHCAANRHRDNGSDGEKWCEHKEQAFGDTAIAGHYREYAREIDDARDQLETYRDALDVGIQ